MIGNRSKRERGFTLVELLVVLAIIAVLASVVIMAIGDSNTKGRDAARKRQSQEIIKALEVMFYDRGTYPTVAAGGVALTNAALQAQIIGTGATVYLRQLPPEPARFYYCASTSGKSMMLAVDTEADEGGSNYCHISRGAGNTADGFGCTAWRTANAANACSTRF